jgi:hypothetical protein
MAGTMVPMPDDGSMAARLKLELAMDTLSLVSPLLIFLGFDANLIVTAALAMEFHESTCSHDDDVSWLTDDKTSSLRRMDAPRAQGNRMGYRAQEEPDLQQL